MSVLTKNFLTVEDTASASQSNWNAEGVALVAEVLQRGGPLVRSLRLRVHGESMLPALWPGEVVEIASCSMEHVRPGEIVLARREGRLFLHRFVAPSTPNGFRLRGDSLPASDPEYPPEALLGKLVRRTADRRTFSSPGLSLGLSPALSRALGILFCRCSTARRLALKLHGRRKASAAAFRNLESI